MPRRKKSAVASGPSPSSSSDGSRAAPATPPPKDDSDSDPLAQSNNAPARDNDGDGPPLPRTETVRTRMIEVSSFTSNPELSLIKRTTAASVFVREVNVAPGTMSELFALISSDAELRRRQIRWSRLTLVRKLGSGQFGDVCLMELAPPNSADRAALEAALSSRASDRSERSHSSASNASGSDAAATLTQRVAVKRLCPASVDKPADCNDFRREIKLLQKLRHPNIVAFKGWGRFGTGADDGGDDGDYDGEEVQGCDADGEGALFLAEELCEGGSLKELVSAESKGDGWQYGGREALRWLLDIARALEYLHDDSSGHIIVHRDLKLANVLLERKPSGVPGEEPPSAKLCDLGIAKPVVIKPAANPMPPPPVPAGVAKEAAAKKRVFSKASSKSFPASLGPKRRSQDLGGGGAPAPSSLRRVQTAYEMTGLTGSVPYMAPEVILNQKYGRRVDVFSWAIIAYELFTKCSVAARHDLDTQAKSENYLAWVAGSRRYRNALPKSWPEPLCQLIRDAWRHDPAARPTSHELRLRVEAMVAEGTCDHMLAAPIVVRCTKGACSVQ